MTRGLLCSPGWPHNSTLPASASLVLGITDMQLKNESLEQKNHFSLTFVPPRINNAHQLRKLFHPSDFPPSSCLLSTALWPPEIRETHTWAQSKFVWF